MALCKFAAGKMARVLAIDYGTKRVGLAVSDPGRNLLIQFGIF